MEQHAEWMLALRNHGCLRAQVATSQLLKRVFATVLATGNALNAGTAHGDADGFRLETLQKLGGVKVGSFAAGS